MYNTTIIKTLGFIAIISFCSCEGGTTFTKTIENNSDESFEIIIYSDLADTEAKTITSGSSLEVYSLERERQFVNESYECVDEIDSVKIELTNGKTLKLDFMDDANWTHNSKDGRNSREDCVFSFANEDIE